MFNKKHDLRCGTNEINKGSERQNKTGNQKQKELMKNIRPI